MLWVAAVSDTGAGISDGVGGDPSNQLSSAVVEVEGVTAEAFCGDAPGHDGTSLDRLREAGQGCVAVDRLGRACRADAADLALELTSNSVLLKQTQHLVASVAELADAFKGEAPALAGSDVLIEALSLFGSSSS